MQNWLPWIFIIIGIMSFIFGLFAMFIYHFDNTSSSSVPGWIWAFLIIGMIVIPIGIILYVMIEVNKKEMINKYLSKQDINDKDKDNIIIKKIEKVQ